MKSQDITVKVSDVYKRFGDFTAVQGLSLEVKAGRVFGLIGPNGAGKTTTIRMIVNVSVPDSGSITLFGEKLNPELQNRIGYLPEERGLYKKMKVVDQLRFFAELKNVRGKLIEERIDKWLARVKLSEWKHRKSIELSKGMQQKVQFLTAILHDPDLLVFDEPFSGLDPVNVELLKDIVIDLKRAGKTIIFSTHQMEIAEKVCDDICLINRSRKILDGSLREVKQSFGRNAVALRIEGSDHALHDTRLVAGIDRHSDELEVLLTEGTNPQQLLRSLIESGATVTKFELVEPSLNDIFIAKVSDSS